MAGKFSDLILIPQGIGRTWVLDVPLIYASKQHGLIVVPRGFECDLNSLPRLAWIVSPRTDYPQAGVIHDWLYRTKAGRAFADRVYREALIVCGCPVWRAWVRWAALRLFGWIAYGATA